MKLLILLLIYPVILFSNNLYDLKDLEVLEKGENYLEFLQHAKDIRPTKRDEHWQGMLKSVSESYIDQQIKNRNFNLKTFKFIEEIGLWPELKRAEFFQQKRASFALSYLKSCLNTESRNCAPDILKHWNNSIQKPENSIEILSLIQNKIKKEDSWQLNRVSTLHAFSNFYCKNSIVKKVAISYIFQNFRKEETAQDLRKKSGEFFNKKCLQTLSPELNKLLLVSDQIESEILFRFLNAQGLLNKDLKPYYLTLYLLRGPIVGSTFNLAWRELELIGQDPKKRSKVLSKLLNLKFLPGSLLTLGHHSRKKAIVNHFTKNMPEYLDSYARSCINYYQGLKKFTYGNPTMECRELLSLSKQIKVIPSPLRSKLSSSLTKH